MYTAIMDRTAGTDSIQQEGEEQQNEESRDGEHDDDEFDDGEEEDEERAVRAGLQTSEGTQCQAMALVLAIPSAGIALNWIVTTLDRSRDGE
jgi:hypothetical protein